LLFKAHHFLLVLQGLQWFNNDSILKEFKSLPKNIQEEADIVIKDLEYGNRIDQPDTSTHKEMLTVIRNNT